MIDVKNGRKTLLAGVALAACLGFSINAQAQTCVTTNWEGGETGSPAVGKQGSESQASGHRRYGGPCGMRAPLNGSPHYVTDPSPTGEVDYIARFYVFVENPGTDPITLFAADDGTADRIQVVYDNGAIILSVWDSGSGSWVDIPSGGVSVGTGWHSVELEWHQNGSSTIALSVDGAADVTATSVDTSGYTLENAHLGNLNGAGGGDWVDFDDFDSRRDNRPGRLLVADVNGDASITTSDYTAVLNEIFGGTYAAGQPDCNEDGQVTTSDYTCVLNEIF